MIQMGERRDEALPQMQWTQAHMAALLLPAVRERGSQGVLAQKVAQVVSRP